MTMSRQERRTAARAALGVVSVLVALSAASVARATPGRGAIVGKVFSQTSGLTLPGALVRVEATATEVVTDAAGRYAIGDVPVGTHRVLVTFPGFGAAFRTDVAVDSDRETSIDVGLVETPTLAENVTVTAGFDNRSREVAGSLHAMNYDEIRRAPGAIGDLGRMVQALPGVAAIQDERNDIVARGGNPIENVTTVDGFEVPNINHFGSQGASGGVISMLSAETVSEASFIAGGLPPDRGDRLSSALDVTLREGSRNRFQAETEIGMGGAGAILEGPLGRDGSWLASVRRSYLDLVAPAFGAGAVPDYANYLVKGVKDLGRWGRIRFVSLGGNDSYDTRTTAPTDDSVDELVDMTSWRTVTGLSLQKYLGAKGTLDVAAAYSATGFSVDNLSYSNPSLETKNDSREDGLSLRASLTLQLARGATLRAGGVVRRLSSDYVLEQPEGWDDEFSTDDTPVNAFSTSTHDTTRQQGGFAQLAISPLPFLDLTVGGRVDRYSLTDTWTATPRGSMLLHLGPLVDLSATYGRYAQLPPLPLMVGLPENRSLAPMRADHTVVGLALTPASDLRLTVEAYDKRYRDYPVSVDRRYLSLASMSGYYDINDILMPMVGQGTGRARGIEFSLQKRLARSFYGQVNYSYSRTEHRALDGILRRSGYDLPHILSLVGGWKLSEKWEVSTKFAYSSGRPITPLLMEESQEQNRAIYDPTRYNEERGPAYHRLDVRVDRRFHRRWGTLALFLEADNVYNRENVLRYSWNEKTASVSTESQLSVLVIGGFTVRF